MTAADLILGLTIGALVLICFALTFAALAAFTIWRRVMRDVENAIENMGPKL